ncbi:MAG: CRISPR-associated endonuclease Cas2 [candidate division Zixibacteria bacterium]|nr:CRISPR-associated endonuclease Cas2 [candidate division Zixibacteria bacterium]
MWLFAMFDLPVDTRAARRNYTRFRKDLLREGFHMLQFSVYARFCGCEERAHVIRTRVHAVLPPDGQVRFVMITDRQFGKMEVYEGKTRAETEKPPPQLSFF